MTSAVVMQLWVDFYDIKNDFKKSQVVQLLVLIRQSIACFEILTFLEMYELTFIFKYLYQYG